MEDMSRFPVVGHNSELLVKSYENTQGFFNTSFLRQFKFNSPKRKDTSNFHFAGFFSYV